MRVLLDSHTFIWFNGMSGRISSRARDYLLDPKNTLHFSLAGFWELTIKVQIGRLHLPFDLNTVIALQTENNSLELLPILPSHVRAYANLPLHHRDPFDRMLIAQAQSERMPVLTADPRFRPYNIETIW